MAEQEARSAMLKAAVQNVGFFVLFGVLLFAPAGTLAWPQGWVFLILFGACSVVLGLWLRKTDPALLAERQKSPFGANQTRRDQLLTAAIFVVLPAWVVFMGLDGRRFHWSHTPAWVQAVGALLIVAAFIGWAGVLRANSFAVTTIRVQTERGQTVISSGPYAVVRHPMYAWVLPLLIGAPLLLGSLWGLLVIVVAMPLLAARALGEEALLMDGLPGYREYATKVRFRLVPWVW